MKVKIKICCIGSPEEAAMAISCGADALGLVSSMPSGPGVISEERIAEIVRGVPQGIETFLLTSRQDALSIVGQQQRTGVNTIQLVDAVPVEELVRLRDALPAVTLVQVIHVLGEESIREAQSVEPYVDALLLDSGNPNLAVKELGGTGRTHNWSVSKKLISSVGIPVFLAGGLHAGNVGEAIQQVRPYGVDLCSGVRTHGVLDKQKLIEFVSAVRGG